MSDTPLSEEAQRAAAIIEQHASALEKQRLFPGQWASHDTARWWFDGDRSLVMLGPHREDLPPPKKFPIVAFTVPEHRRKGLHRTLLQHVQRTLQSEGHAEGIFSIRTNSLITDGPACYSALGFSTAGETIEMECETYITPETDRIKDVTFQFYNGGDPDLDTRIFDFEEVLYRADMANMITLPQRNPKRFSDANTCLILAMTDDGELVGEAEAIIDPPFATRLGVARRYWGTRVANELCYRLISTLANKGVTKLYSYVRITNAASIRLQKRVGAIESCRVVEWGRPFFDAT